MPFEMPTCQMEDLKLFTSIVSDLFPRMKEEPVDYGDMDTSMRARTIEKGLEDVEGECVCGHPPISGQEVAAVQGRALSLQLCHAHQLPGAPSHLHQAPATEEVRDQHTEESYQEWPGQAAEHGTGYSTTTTPSHAHADSGCHMRGPPSWVGPPS